MPDYLTVAEEAARAGGAVLLKWRDRISPREKGPRDLVTEADLESQQAVRRVVMGAFPRHRFLGEEDIPESAEPGDADSPFRWIVDPLDGTTNYVHGLAGYAVSIALEERGEIIAGVVYDPLAGECFLAAQGSGASVGGRPLSVSGCERLSEALAAASFAAGVKADSEEIRRFLNVLDRAQAVRRLGSAALNLCYLAAGRLDVYWATSVSVWDIAAGQLIAREAGGKVTHFSGGPLDLADPRFAAAATPALHRELMNTIALHSKAGKDL